MNVYVYYISFSSTLSFHLFFLILSVFTLTRSQLSEEQLRAQVVEAESLLEKGDQTSLTRAWIMRSTAQYSLATWIRADNTRAMGKYLGYLDAQELYPDFKPISFAEYIDELAAGTVTRPYESTLFQTLKKEGYASTE